MRVIKQTTTQKNVFKNITCFNDLIAGIEHWNGNSQHANIYNLIDNNTVSVQHYYRYGKNKKPFTMTKIDFDNWLSNL